MSAYFVAGAGTGIGKTFTTCALVRGLRMRGVNAQGFKPIISGFDVTDMNSDTAQIIEVNGASHSVDDVSPWRFSAPLSPHRAALLESTSIDTGRLVAWTRSAAQKSAISLIETVGGVMVPLNDTQTTLDWMEEVNLPVILVTGSYLGAINHTLMSLAVLRGRRLSVRAIVLNESEGSTVTLAEAEAGLKPFISDIPLRIVQPRVSSYQQASAIQAMEI